MATYDKEGQMTYKDEEGNTYLLNPKTKMRCVEGLETALTGKAPVSHAENKNNPHGVTAEQVGARPNTWMPTADQVGARPDTWMPTASQVGATPASHATNKNNPHGVTAFQIGAATMEYVKEVGNPQNLLDNSDFRNPVNRREKTTYTGGYGLDRWITALTVAIKSGYVNIANPTTSTYVLYQKFNVGKLKSGTTYTCAYETSNGKIFVHSTTSAAPSAYDANGFRLAIQINTNGTDNLACAVLPGSSINMKWIALYEGAYTADTLPKYQPKGYEYELMVCSQYNSESGEYIGLRKIGQPHNLLDNSDFRNPVNQRGVDDYSALTSHTDWLDRWRIYGDDATFRRYDKYIEILNGGSSTCGLYQRVEASKLEAGKTYTLAAKLSAAATSENVVALSYSTAASAASEYIAESKYIPTGSNQIVAFPFVLQKSTDGLYNFRFRSAAAYSKVTIEWIALYEGEYTADTLPEYQAKGYAAELLECQRYFVRYSGITLGGTVWGGTAPTGATFSLFTPAVMRLTNPTVTIGALGSVRANGNSFTPSSVTISARSGNKLQVTANGDFAGAGNHAAALFGFSADLSADL